MEPINVNAYQDGRKKTFKVHEPLTPEEAALLDWALGLGGEAGEVQELVKHHVYGKEELDKMKLAKELGDVIWYVSAIAAQTGIDLESIFLLNQAKLDHRYLRGTYSHEESAARHQQEARFEDTIEYQELRARIWGCTEDVG